VPGWFSLIMGQWQLVQVNIARAKDDLDSPVLKEFVERLDEINALADRASGFVWRLQTEDGDATSIQAFDDPQLIINMSVWRDIESLKQFVYQTSHVELIRARAQWFQSIKTVHQAMWWVKGGHLPDLQEARDRMEHLQLHGADQTAFTFAKPYPPPSD